MLGIFSPRFFRFPACVPWDWDAPAGATPSSSPCFPRDFPFHGILEGLWSFSGLLSGVSSGSCSSQTKEPRNGILPFIPAFPFPKILRLGAKSRKIKRKTHPVLSDTSGSWNSLLGIPNPKISQNSRRFRAALHALPAFPFPSFQAQSHLPSLQPGTGSSFSIPLGM